MSLTLRGSALCGLEGWLWKQPGQSFWDQERRSRAGVRGWGGGVVVRKFSEQKAGRTTAEREEEGGGVMLELLGRGVGRSGGYSLGVVRVGWGGGV